MILTAHQQSVIARIAALKREPHPDRPELMRLTRLLIRMDDDPCYVPPASALATHRPRQTPPPGIDDANTHFP